MQILDNPSPDSHITTQYVPLERHAISMTNSKIGLELSDYCSFQILFPVLNLPFNFSISLVQQVTRLWRLKQDG